MRSGTRMNEEGFSSCVQHYLRGSGYSQKELAEEIGLNPKVLSRKLNGSRNAQLTQLEIRQIITTLAGWHVITTYEEVLYLLEQAQMTSGSFSTQEWQAPPLSILARKSGPVPPARTPAQPEQQLLPTPTTRLIGREWAVERLTQLIKRPEVRLVTLFGSGGSGKTRLALHVANEVANTFAQAVRFVALASIYDPAQVPMSILQALNIKSSPTAPPLQSLISFLKNKHLLLLLDNFEHLIAATDVIAELLAGVPGLKILATSRTVLHLYEEHEFSVPPLDIPDLNSALNVPEIIQYGAVQLFMERAQAVQPGFALTPENAGSIAYICARVDGLPLALELAAARIKSLSPEVLLERLSLARLPLLTRGPRNLPSRQQTLKDTITWSYNLLSPEEQAWFNRLGIFSGGWSLEAVEVLMQELATAQQSATTDLTPLDLLEELLDNSLIVRLPAINGQPRFSMLETLREYALEQLTALGELERLYDWHACYYLNEAEAGEVGIRGPHLTRWLAYLTSERANFQAALDWALQAARQGLQIRPCFCSSREILARGRKVACCCILTSRGDPAAGLSAAELALRLAAAFRAYWEWQGYLPAVRNWLKAALSIPLAEPTETMLAARAKALSELSRLMNLQNDQQQAIALIEESITLWHQLDDAQGLAIALLNRARAAYAESDYETAQVCCQEGLEALSTTDDVSLRAQLLFYCGTTAGFLGNYDQMRTCYTQSKALFEQVGDKLGLADLLKDQGAMLLLESKYTESIHCLLACLRLCYTLDHKQFISSCLDWLSLAIGMRQEPNPATASLYSAQLSGAADGLMNAIGSSSWSKTQPFIKAVKQYIRSQMDEQSWQAAWTEGRSLSVEQAIDLAHRLARSS